jgi:hypothetical protein
MRNANLFTNAAVNQTFNGANNWMISFAVFGPAFS